MKKQIFLLILGTGLIGCSVESPDSAEELLIANAETSLQEFTGITNPGFKMEHYDMVKKHKSDPAKDELLGRVFVSNNCSNLLLKFEGTAVANLGLYTLDSIFPAKNGANENVDSEGLHFNEIDNPELFWEIPIADLGDDLTEINIFANAGGKTWAGDLSWGNAFYINYTFDFEACRDACTYGLGWWKNHPAQWPAGGLKLGNNTYSPSQLQSILNQKVKGNGMIILAHHLIATKLNLENGSNPTDVSAAVAAADALIGSSNVLTATLPTNRVGEIKDALESFNEGITGPGNCEADNK